MAEEEDHEPLQPPHQQQQEVENMKKLVSSYMGLGLGLFMAQLPKHTVTAVKRLEAEVREMRWRRQEDSKANARVVEIFASHRNAWQQEEKRLLRQIDAAAEEIARLRGTLDELQKERDETVSFMSMSRTVRNGTEKKLEEEEEEEGEGIGRGLGLGGFRSRSRECYGVGSGNSSEWFRKEEEEEEECEVESTRSLGEEEIRYENEDEHAHINQQYNYQELGIGIGIGNGNVFDSEFMASASSKFWAEKSSLWQDVQYESLESVYNTKHFVARRESPWKVDGDSAGVSSKLKLLEQELLNMEKISKSDLSKVSSLIKKQAKRYQALSEKIEDLCRRIQASDPSEPTLSAEFRTQTQTEFLLEAFRLQQGASETGQKLMALQTEIGKSHYRDEVRSETTPTTRRLFDSIKNNFKEIQRNLEIWLARIIGDLEGILARDGASRVREYYISRYPFVQ